MRKYAIAVLLVVLGLVFAANAQAGMATNKDLDDNGRAFTIHYCPSGSKVAGMAYFDLKNDAADAVSPICEFTKGARKGEIYIPKDEDWPSSGLREIQQHKCDLSRERIYGVRYKDRDATLSRDAMDGLSVGCKDKRNGTIRWTANYDTIGGREWETLLVGKGTVIGVAYKDGGCGGIKSDCVDGATFVVR